MKKRVLGAGTVPRKRPGSEGVTSREHWESVGASYSLQWAKPSKEVLSRDELAFVSGQLPGQARRGLDVGVGNGRILAALLDSSDGTVFYGMDAAESMLAVCRDRFAGEPRVAELRVCDVFSERSPFGLQFDFISAIRVLKYGEDWQGAVASLLRELHPGGTMVFSIPNRRSLSRFSRAYAVPWQKATKREIVTMARRLGADVVKLGGSSHLPFFVYELDRPRCVSKWVIAAERLMAKVLGPSCLARELFVALKSSEADCVLEQHLDRLVVVERGGTVVRKMFTAEAPEDQALAAQREFMRLGRFHDALSGLERASSPRPLEMVEHPAPAIRMERVGGRPLLEVLGAQQVTSERLSHLATVAADAL